MYTCSKKKKMVEYVGIQYRIFGWFTFGMESVEEYNTL